MKGTLKHITIYGSMNNTIINIDGIKIHQRNVHLEHSTDTANLIVIQDEQGNEIVITIINGVIIKFNN